MWRLVGETRVRKGFREVVTLQAETTTPRRRKVSNSYERQCTPAAELYPAGRKRRKAASNARSRALCWFDASKHDAYLVQERERKRAAAKRERPQATSAPAPIVLPPWATTQPEMHIWRQWVAEREAQGYKAIQLGPRGWSCNGGGWIWQDPTGRIIDNSRIWDDAGKYFPADLLWRNGHACGICACTECGITEHPCACEKPPDPDRANWAAVSRGAVSRDGKLCVPAEWYRQSEG